VLPEVLSLPGDAPNKVFPAEVSMISQIVYASSASKAFTKPDLQALLQEIRPKNAELGVTGMLLYKDGNFMQALEGDQEVLTRVVGIIERDSRHSGFLVLLRSTSEERLFPDWSMGFRDLSDQSAAKMAGYSDFMNTALIGRIVAGSKSLCETDATL
jgi:Sensors of blue-light using FAD